LRCWRLVLEGAHELLRWLAPRDEACAPRAIRAVSGLFGSQ
jgi:hypothetical protein